MANRLIFQFYAYPHRVSRILGQYREFFVAGSSFKSLTQKMIYLVA